jgi:hypothetical protein
VLLLSNPAHVKNDRFNGSLRTNEPLISLLRATIAQCRSLIGERGPHALARTVERLRVVYVVQTIRVLTLAIVQ